MQPNDIIIKLNKKLYMMVNKDYIKTFF